MSAPTLLFLPGDGWLHRLHPRTKLAAVGAAGLLAYTPLLVWEGVPTLPWGVVALLFVAGWVDSPQVARLLLQRLLLLLLPLALSLFVVQGFFFPGAHTILLELGPFALKAEGLRFGATILTRLALLLGALLLFLLTTDPADLAHTLTQLGLPHEVAYILLATLHLLPWMHARAQRILAAQRARGLQTEGTLLVRARALVPLLIPLFISAIQEAELRALALEARAFRAPGPRTAWRQLPDSLAQRLARWFLLGGALVLWLLFHLDAA